MRVNRIHAAMRDTRDARPDMHASKLGGSPSAALNSVHSWNTEVLLEHTDKEGKELQKCIALLFAAPEPTSCPRISAHPLTSNIAMRSRACNQKIILDKSVVEAIATI